VATLDEQNAILERQRAYFASDERIIERARLWRDATPEECLASLDELCRDADLMLDMMEPAARDRAQAFSAQLPDDTIAILEGLWRTRHLGR
jgi:hypothetical protein